MNSCASGVSGKPEVLSEENRASGVFDDDAAKTSFTEGGKETMNWRHT
jgi:hypothetical protein